MRNKRLDPKETSSEALKILITFHNFYCYIQQHSYAGKTPSHELVLCEEYFDSLGMQNIIFHALYGRRTLDALSRAYAYKIGREYHTNVAVTISDNGFILKLPVQKRVELGGISKILKSEEMGRIAKIVVSS